MNKQHVEDAIAIMTRVRNRGDKVDMEVWQRLKTDQHTGEMYACAEEDEIHKCGTAACFAGWVAVSPEFKRAGGFVDRYHGRPFFVISGEYISGIEAITKWLDIPHTEAAAICHLGSNHEVRKVYGRTTDDKAITAQDVIDALTRLRETGSAIRPIE